MAWQVTYLYIFRSRMSNTFSTTRPAKRVRFDDTAPQNDTHLSQDASQFSTSSQSSTVDGDEDTLGPIERSCPITILDFFLDGDNIPQAEVRYTTILWKKAKDIKDQKKFADFLGRCPSWKPFIQAKEMGNEKYRPPQRWVGSTEIDTFTGMQLIGDQWMVCGQAIVQAWIKPEDWKGDEQLQQAIVHYCEKRKDWTNLGK